LSLGLSLVFRASPIEGEGSVWQLESKIN
jgi:hypothetical protein